MINTLENEEILKVCLLILDDIHKSNLRFKKIKKGKKPGPFYPGETIYNTALKPIILYETAEEKSFKAA